MYKGVEQWVMIDGNWGDTIVELLNYYQQYKKFGVIFFALEGKPIAETRRILELVNAQPFVQETIYDPTMIGWRENIEHTMARLEELCGYYNIDANKVDMSHIGYYNTSNGLNYYENSPRLVLPYIYNFKNYNIDNFENCILLHPYSCAVTPVWWHWPHWEKLLDFLFDYTKYTFILTGHSEFNYSTKYNNVINLIGNQEILESNCDVFNISNKCAYTITTANSLSHWCINQKNKAFIIGNQSQALYSAVWAGAYEIGSSSDSIFYNYNSKLLFVLYDIFEKIQLTTKTTQTSLISP